MKTVNKGYLAVILVGIVAIVLAGYYLFRSGAGDDVFNSGKTAPAAGKEKPSGDDAVFMPPFRLQSVQDGKLFESSELKGKVALISFFASW